MISITTKGKPTSTEVKQCRKANNHKKCMVRFRNDETELIEFIENNKEKYGTSKLFPM